MEFADACIGVSVFGHSHPSGSRTGESGNLKWIRQPADDKTIPRGLPRGHSFNKNL